MIAYNKTELENQFLIEEAHSLYKAGFISKENYTTIEDQLPTVKKQKNILIRLGMTVLGVFLYSSICGFLTLVGLSQIDDNFNFLLYLYAIIGFAGVEFYAKQNYKEQGLDDTFLIGGQGLLAIAIGMTTNGYELVIASIATAIALLTYIRYINLNSVYIFCISSTATIAYTLFEIGSMGKIILPFALMLFAVALYIVSQKLIQKIVFPLYHKGIVVVKNFSLVLFYLSGNYLVVRELSVALLGNEIAPNSDIPFAWFFYAFTFIVPAIYIVYGLRDKKRSMLWIGFVATVFSIYTIRYYHHLLPTEVALTVGGLLLFCITYFSIKKIKDKTSGITFHPDRFINSSDFIHTEALILTSQFGLKPEVHTESPMEFGGGDFSGGGSGGSF
ncbi:hypothetical protein [Flavobacterium sp.]|uniref:hypothetical protein n=1 Tax=Flavobacterium sp. TaxID=239 RepID=UPI003C351E35